MILTIQKEVAERICAKPGSSERGILTVMVEYYVENVEIVEIVGRENFWPIPKVDSAVIKIKVLDNRYKVIDENEKIKFNIQNLKPITHNLLPDPKVFFRIVKIGFSQKRRQIHHPLAAGLYLSKDKILDILKKAKINPTLRAEDLELKDWIRLAKQCTNLHESYYTNHTNYNN